MKISGEVRIDVHLGEKGSDPTARGGFDKLPEIRLHRALEAQARCDDGFPLARLEKSSRYV
jgi:hypothetical protein